MIELALPSMTCGHCVKTVTHTVQRLDAQAKVEIELEKHRVRIESQVGAIKLKKALDAAGYPAQ